MIAVMMSVAITRIVLILISLGLWHWTQKLLARRNPTGEPGCPSPVSETVATADQGGNTSELSAERLQLIQRLIDGDQEPREQSVVRAGERSGLVQRLLGGDQEMPAYIKDLLAVMAVSVAGTEAVVFFIEGAGQDLSLKTIAHLRPDPGSAEVREAALTAFRLLIKPCIAQAKDGAIEVGKATPPQDDPQYCLITLLREGPKVVGAAAIITRCPDLQKARQRLLTLQIIAGYFDFRSQLRRKEMAAQWPATDAISDGIHRLTARTNQRLLDNPKQANALLIASSLVIDLLGIYLLVTAIIGPTFSPFLGLLLVFGLRQIVQAFCPLPPPRGMIWRSTGAPSLLVTYGTSCDLFFSGHTAIAVLGCATLAGALGPTGIVIGCAIAAFEIWAVLVLRAHYTMDVFTGALAALYIHQLVIDFAPHVDGWIRQFAAWFS